MNEFALYTQQDIASLLTLAQANRELADMLVLLSQSFPNGTPARVDLVDAASTLRAYADSLDLKHQYITNFQEEANQ